LSVNNSEDAGRYMARCEELAAQARGQGEASVGAVIVRERHVIAEAMEQVVAQHDVTGHAELLAIRAACRNLNTFDLSGCTLYTNVEPCIMCSFAIRETGIEHVVIGRAVEEIGGATSRFPILTDDSIGSWRAPPFIEWRECG
jgi:tRNA(Arg) A34 adenosine deaminase TadA